MPILPIYFYTYVALERENVKETLQHEPARPGRPDQGRRHRVERFTCERVGAPAGASTAFGIQWRGNERAGMLKFIVRRIFWTIPGPARRDLPDVHDDAADRRQPVPPERARGARGRAAQPRAEVQRRQALVHAVRALREGRRHVRPRPVARRPRPHRERHRQDQLPQVDRARGLRVPLRGRDRRPARDDRRAPAQHGRRLRRRCSSPTSSTRSRAS